MLCTIQYEHELLITIKLNVVIVITELYSYYITQHLNVFCTDPLIAKGKSKVDLLTSTETNKQKILGLSNDEVKIISLLLGVYKIHLKPYKYHQGIVYPSCESPGYRM